MNTQSEKVLDRLREAYGIPEGWGWRAALAGKIGVRQNLVSSWKARGVPEKIVANAVIDTGVNRSWLESGEGEMRQGGGHPAIHIVPHHGSVLSVDIASQAMEKLDAFLELKKMNPSPKMKRKLYEGLIEEYLDREEQVEMEVILNELAAG